MKVPQKYHATGKPVMRDDSTPKETVTNKKPSMSNFCRLCTESSFKIIYGNFPSKSSAGEPSEAQQPKTSYLSMDTEGRRKAWTLIWQSLDLPVSKLLAFPCHGERATDDPRTKEAISPHALTGRNQKPSRLPQMMMETRNVCLIFNPYFLVKRQWTNLPRMLQQCECDKSLNRRNSIHRFTGTICRFYTSKIFTYFTNKASDSTYFTDELFDLL